MYENILFLILISRIGEGNQEDEEIAAEDEEDMGVIETYSNYMPTKLKVTLPALNLL